MTKEAAIISIIETVRRLCNDKNISITSDTSLLVQVDLDSLQILELAECIKEQYGVDLLAEASPMAAFNTPRTVSDAILRLQTERNTSSQLSCPQKHEADA